MHHGNLLQLTGADIVQFFNDKSVLSTQIFQYLLCMRHDEIMHKPEAAGYRIFVSPEFFVSGQYKNIQKNYTCSHHFNYYVT
jgi:hypothetical protein